MRGTLPLLVILLGATPSRAASLVETVKTQLGVGAPTGAEVLGTLQAVSIPGQPGAVELRQALQPEVYTALQALDRLDPSAPESQEAVADLARQLPKGFLSRLQKYASHPTSGEARELAALLSAAHERASDAVGKRIAERVARALEKVKLGQSSLGEVDALAADIDRFDLYGASVWTAGNRLRQTAAGFLASGPSETAEETAARLLKGPKPARGAAALQPAGGADAEAQPEAVPAPAPVGSVTAVDLVKSLRHLFEEDGYELRERTDSYEFVKRGHKAAVILKGAGPNGVLTLWIANTWYGFHNDLAEKGIVVGPAQAFKGDLDRYGVDARRFEPAVAQTRMRDAVLGTGEVRWTDDLIQMRIRALATLMPLAQRRAVLAEIDKISQMRSGDAEYAGSRKWVETMVNIPWSRTTPDRLDLRRARLLMDADQYGLDKVKARIIEFLAVRKRSKTKGVVLTFDGPPGVGKTALGKAIAKALGRKFVRVALGGVSSEDDIRGHRRTFIGALPGSIIDALIEARTRNPVMQLDEIDKLGHDGTRGDPAAAMLEVLDPEQNDSFRDHYVGYPVDLSDVFFIASSNELHKIPKPLLDRMEVIRFPSYSSEEKIEISGRYLLPKSLEKHGLTAQMASLSRQALAWLDEGYTYGEGGVRRLGQLIDEITRKAATAIELGDAAPGEIDAKQLAEYLGPAPYGQHATAVNGTGVVTGLVVMSGSGMGAVTNVEVVTPPGTGKLQLRNQFKNMAEDSARNALAYLKSNLAKYGVEKDALDKIDIEPTFTPAVDTDGPSAGTLIATGVLSRLTGRPARRGVAMTGEITVTGRVLPIGGLAEKIKAAKRAGNYAVIFPRANLPELQNMSAHELQGLKLIPVDTADQVFAQALSPARAQQ